MANTGDIDKDGDCDLNDLSILATDYGKKTVLRHCGDHIDSLIKGKDPLTTKRLFSVQDHANAVYVRDPNCWAAPLDMTCASPYNTKYGHLAAGTLITPRHIVFANHYTIWEPCQVRFVGKNNEVFIADHIQSMQVGGSDIRIGLLAQDVPAFIKPAKILPANWKEYIGGNGYGIAAVATDQEEKALICNIGGLVQGLLTQMLKPLDNPNRVPFNEPLIMFDSGNPVLIFLHGEPVILTCWQYGGQGSGPSMTYYLDQIKQTITALGGPQIQEVDLKRYLKI